MNIEELQMEVDIRRYDMKDAPMTKQRNLLLLEVRVYVQGSYMYNVHTLNFTNKF